MKLVKSTGKRKPSEAKKFFLENYDPDVKLNITETAKSLGVTAPTIYNWIKEIKAND